jgi:acetyl esterase/lipase
MCHAHLSPTRRSFALAAALAFLALPACRITDVPLWGPPGPPPDALAVERIEAVSYCEGPVADAYRHQLDLFLPRDKKDFPVVVLVHGGAWVMGDNRCCGLYSAVGEFLASRGVGAVLPNYRLSPEVRHPEHARDVARAVAWTHRHIAEYGGQPDQLFLAGHSAGGHLVALLATDEQYLEAEGLKSTDLKGVIAVSGVYRIPPGSLDVTLGGTTPVAFRLDELAPLRQAGGRSWVARLGLPGIPLSVNIYGQAFGDDPDVRADASPVHHVRPGLPPFLLFSADNDLPTLPGMAQEFAQALREQGGEVQHITVEHRNHNSIFFRAVEVGDQVAQAMLAFVHEHP